jgi:hypothetical protein
MGYYYEFLTTSISEMAARVDDNRRGHFAVELALFTLIMDAGLVTVEQACERLAAIEAALSEPCHSEATTLRISWLGSGPIKLLA